MRWGPPCRRGLVAARGRGPKPDVHRFRGTEGDWVVMVTDGVLCGRDDRWVRDLLAAYQGDSPSDLAQRILRQSQDLCQGEDDGTVLVARLEGREGGMNAPRAGPGAWPPYVPYGWSGLLPTSGRSAPGGMPAGGLHFSCEKWRKEHQRGEFLPSGLPTLVWDILRGIPLFLFPGLRPCIPRGKGPAPQLGGLGGAGW